MIDFNNKTWKKNWAGKWSLLECCYYGKYYTTSLTKYHGVGLQNAFFTFENGNSANFLVEEELISFGRALADKLTSDPKIVSEWAENAKIQGDKALELMKSIEVRKIGKKDFDELWNILEIYLAVSFPIKRVADYLDPMVLEKLLPIFEEVRVYGEPVYAQSALFVKRFAEELSSEYGISPEVILSMLNTEFEEFFTTKKLPAKEILQDRYQKSLLAVVGGLNEIIEKNQISTVEKKLLSEQNSKELKGTPAFNGIVKGKVRVIFNPDKVKDLEPNTVLVTGMTRPEYLHLFEQAVAVLTDAGGILSHAAITARELKKPTIVGIEIATKVLKDGDMVEVDAERGVVHVIK